MRSSTLAKTTCFIDENYDLLCEAKDTLASRFTFICLPSTYSSYKFVLQREKQIDSQPIRDDDDNVGI